MQSLGDALKTFDLEAIRRRAAAARANPRSTEESGTIQKYRCPKCQDEGGTLERRSVSQMVKGEMKDVSMDFWVICECVARDKIERLMRASSITEEFQKKTFDTFNLDGVHDSIREAYRKARVFYARFNEIRESKNNGICLLGRPGCGKTHLLTAVSNGLIGNGVEVVYFPYVESFEEIKADMKKDDINDKRFEKIMKAEVLFIDDLFKPPMKISDYELKQVFKVINYRYMERKPILVSSEHDINDLLDIDEALGSRIKEMCNEFRVVLKGGREMNYRLREDESA